MFLKVRTDFSSSYRFLHSLKTSGLDFRPFWPLVQTLYYQYLARSFRVEGHPDKWAALRPATLRRRRKGRNRSAGLRPRILRDTGQLEQAVTSPTDDKAYSRITRTTLTVGTRLRYAHFHQFGTRNMVARPIYTADTPFLRRAQAFCVQAIMKKATA